MLGLAQDDRWHSSTRHQPLEFTLELKHNNAQLGKAGCDKTLKFINHNFIFTAMNRPSCLQQGNFKVRINFPSQTINNLITKYFYILTCI